jgi:O-antigen ligase/Flp pilus assembly protein TadD
MGYRDWAPADHRPGSIAAFRLLLFVVIFSPLAFGTVELWSLTVMQLAALFCLSLLLFFTVTQGGKGWYEVPGTVPLLLLLGYIFLQTVPLPPAFLKVVSPATHSLYEKTVWTVQPHVWASLSVSRKTTMAEFFRYASYAAVYIAAVQLLTDSRLLRRTITVLIAFAALLAFFSILQHLISNDRIYWVRELTQGGIPFGPYVNRNHYAGLMGMIFPVILSLFLLYRPPSHTAGLRKRLAETFTHPTTNIYLLLGFSAVVTATSVFISLSRGGIASLCVSLIFLAIVLNRKIRAHRRGLLLAVTAVIILYAVGWFGWGPIFERFRNIRTPQGDISELRFDIWRDSAGIVRDFPLTGTGFGSFIQVYTAYRTIDSDRIADHAHNDYIELFADGGAAGALIFFVFLATVLRRSFRTFSCRKDPFSLYLYCGTITGILTFLLHSFTDFNLQIGANGLYFFFLLGLAVSASHTRTEDNPDRTLLQGTGPGGKKMSLAASALLLVLCVIFNAGQFSGAFLRNEVKGIRLDSSSPKATLSAVSDTFRRASLFDPLEASYYYRTAAAESLLQDHREALRHYERSLLLQPTNSTHLQAFGVFLSGIGRKDNAERLLRAAVTYDGTNPAAHRTFGGWLIAEGRTEEGLQTIRAAISLEPARTSEYIAMLILSGLDDREIRKGLPGEAEPHRIFAQYLERTGMDSMASEEYLQAIAYSSAGKNPSPATFDTAFRFFQKKGMHEQAAEVMQQAAELFPKDITVRMRLAETYEAMGRKSDAAAQYRQIVEIDRRNEHAMKKIEELR